MMVCFLLNIPYRQFMIKKEKEAKSITMIQGKIVSIQKMKSAEIILIEYEENNSLSYCYSMRGYDDENRVKVGDVVVFEEMIDILGPVAINLSKVE